MKIGKDKVVVMTYRLTAGSQDGDLIQETDVNHPFAFIFGLGSVLPDFEKHLEGKERGNGFGFGIPSERAYGAFIEEAIVDVPQAAFAGAPAEQLAEFLKVGNTLPMKDENGELVEGLILEITDKYVKMDFNHPLAGVDLYFEGEVLEVRNATEEELAHGHVHGVGGHHH